MHAMSHADAYANAERALAVLSRCMCSFGGWDGGLQGAGGDQWGSKSPQDDWQLKREWQAAGVNTMVDSQPDGFGGQSVDSELPDHDN